MIKERKSHDCLSKSHFISQDNISMLMPSSDKPVKTGNLILFKLLVRLFKFGNLSIGHIILHNLIVHLSHNFLNLLVQQLSVDLGLLERVNSFHNGVDFLVTLPLSFLFSEAKHFLMVFNQLVKTVSLILVQRSIVAIVILNFFVEDRLKHRFGLPRALAI